MRKCIQFCQELQKSENDHHCRVVILQYTKNNGSQKTNIEKECNIRLLTINLHVKSDLVYGSMRIFI